MAAVSPHPSVAERLSAAGLRSTASRRSVLDMLSAGGHMEASAVYEQLRETLPGTSLQAVYGVLSALTEADLVRRITPDGGPARYEARVGDNHHHLICSECGAIEDVPCVVGSAPCLAPVDALGFTVEVAEVVFRGRCAACSAARSA
ncbi:Fur family transcriptional regulator [Leucobacter sp. PH1c]|uniref:Fur family transcriptional regulator n=1 Tax=Leucobacter sp. PH1c TaxID=1397278 RepID=UPI000469A3AA|nr:Fur family transcriptional regulator [Leucobacter sp. PH1c]